MECHYHPGREGTDTCAICGKSICKECGLEIAGKIYCKDCLEKIVGLGLNNNAPQAAPEPAQPQVQSEPVYEEQVIDESIYQPQEEYEIPYAPDEHGTENKAISDDSPYNIRDNIEYSGGLESSYISESENNYQETPQVTQDEYNYQPETVQQAVSQQPETIQQQPISQQPEYNYQPETIQQQPVSQEQEYIYPDHDYEPQPTQARQNLEDKYEKYLDDLYFEENEVPLEEQLAKDESKYGSLTKKEYRPRPVQEPPKQQIPRNETPEQMEARIRAEIAREQNVAMEKGDNGIHNLNYKEEKEPMGAVDILLTIILIIVILIVIYYLIYLFVLSATYPTYMDAIFALRNPQNVINHIVTSF